MSDLVELITRTAQQYGRNPDSMLRIAQLESSMNPSAQNGSSSAGGLFQFVDSTWGQYGQGNKMDPAANTVAAAKYLTDVEGSLSRSLGRAPEPWELYLGHQQGAGGAAKLLSNPDALAASLVGGDAIRLNGGNAATMTAQDFANIWKNKYNGVSAPASAPWNGQGSAPGAATALAGLFGPGGVPAAPQAPFAGLLQRQRDEREDEEEQRKAEQARLAALFAPVQA